MRIFVFSIIVLLSGSAKGRRLVLSDFTYSTAIELNREIHVDDMDVVSSLQDYTRPFIFECEMRTVENAGLPPSVATVDIQDVNNNRHFSVRLYGPLSTWSVEGTSSGGSAAGPVSDTGTFNRITVELDAVSGMTFHLNGVPKYISTESGSLRKIRFRGAGVFRNIFIKDPTNCQRLGCGFNAECADNTTCQCSPGYNPSGANLDLECPDINECDENPCLENQECVNVPSNFTCKCNPGYFGGNVTTNCTDINECNANPCLENQACTNSIGSFRCDCNAGYFGGNVTTNCTDINECDTNTCGNGTCINIPGSYNCSCNSGYAGSSFCSDINECEDNPCGENTDCTNYPGNYSCTCKPGFIGNATTGCYDPDYCASNPCNSTNNSTCTNVLGGYKCSCVKGFGGDGVTYCEPKCIVRKSCQCNSYSSPFDLTLLQTSLLYSGGDSEALVNASLELIGKFDANAVEMLCKESKCDADALESFAQNLDSNVTEIGLSIQNITGARTNLRKEIDCLDANNSIKHKMFDHYEILMHRQTILSNVLEDFKMKVKIVRAEITRCTSRTWMRTVLENIWH